MMIIRELERIKKKIKSKPKILVFGDVILDITILGKAIGISSETPTIAGNEIEKIISLGGAGLIAKNLCYLECDNEFFSVGKKNQDKTLSKLVDSKITYFQDNNFEFPQKKRYWLDNYKVLQLNKGFANKISNNTENLIIKTISNKFKNDHVDALILGDYRTGIFDNNLANDIISLCMEFNVKCFADSQVHRSEQRFNKFKNSFLFLNELEAASVLGVKSFSNTKENMISLNDVLSSNLFVVKFGKDGSMLYDNGKVYEQESIPVKVVDTTGAGDSFLAAFSFVCNYVDLKDAIFFASCWSSYFISKRIDQICSIREFWECKWLMD